MDDFSRQIILNSSQSEHIEVSIFVYFEELGQPRSWGLCQVVVNSGKGKVSPHKFWVNLCSPVARIRSAPTDAGDRRVSVETTMEIYTLLSLL